MNSSKGGFSGNLGDMNVVDLVQTFEMGRKTGTISLSGGDRGIIYFREGRVVDAECVGLRGEGAFYRILKVFEGSFEAHFTPVELPVRIQVSTPALLMEGMRRQDESRRLLAQLPPLETQVEVNQEKLLDRLPDVPDEANALLRRLDGTRNLAQALEESGLDEVAALGILCKWYAEGLLRRMQATKSKLEAPSPETMRPSLTAPAESSPAPTSKPNPPLTAPSDDLDGRPKKPPRRIGRKLGILLGGVAALALAVRFYRPRFGHKPPARASLALPPRNAIGPEPEFAPDESLIAPLVSPAQSPAQEKGDYKRWMELGRAANEAGKFKLAVRAYRKALVENSESTQAKVELAIALVNGARERREFEDAVRMLKQGAEADAHNPRVWLALGMGYQSLEQNSLAVEAYRKYVELEPDGPTARDVRAIMTELDR